MKICDSELNGSAGSLSVICSCQFPQENSKYYNFILQFGGQTSTLSLPSIFQTISSYHLIELCFSSWWLFS